VGYGGEGERGNKKNLGAFRDLGFSPFDRDPCDHHALERLIYLEKYS
jgi:hypothetical protein